MKFHIFRIHEQTIIVIVEMQINNKANKPAEKLKINRFAQEIYLHLN